MPATAKKPASSKPAAKPAPKPSAEPSSKQPVAVAPGTTPKAERSKLPLVSVINDQPTMEHARALLEEAAKIKKRNDEDAERLKEIRLELADLADAYNLPGMRHGSIGLQYNGKRSNMVLDRAKLVENGVDPEIIKASLAPTKEFVDCKFVDF